MVDFRKAFNYVNRSILFFKLIQSGLTGRIVKLLKDMYSKIKAKIKVGNWLYDWLIDESGTNQGGPLSPNMFRRMLCNLKNYLDINHGVVIDDDEILVHLLWADDLVLMASSAEGLQKQLDGLHRFCSKYQLIVNTLKTRIMLYGNIRGSVQFMFNNEVLEECQTYKYLGVLFSPIKTANGNIFRDMYKYVTEKSRRASFVATRKCAGIGKMTPKVGLHLYDSFVRSVTEYGCEIWSLGKEFQEIETVQLRFIKMLLGVKLSTANVAIYAETARYPSFINFQLKTVKFYLRLLQMNNNSIVKKVFLELSKLDHLGLTTCNWVSNVKNMFYRCKIHDLIPVNIIEDKKSDALINVIKKRLQDNFQSQCMFTINNMPILRTYCKFKYVFEAEPYLRTITSYNIRSMLSKFRLSSHVLEIEKGRHNKVLLADRICKACDLNQIEDEIHFFLYCPLYTKERSMFFKLCDINKTITISDECNFIGSR